MKKPILLASWIMCPDGTMLPSFTKHDFRKHETIDKTEIVHPEGKEEPEDLFSEEWRTWNKEAETVVVESRHSIIDGGTDYLKRSGVFTEMSIYSDDPFEVIRRFLCRGARGVDLNRPLTYIPLFRMSNKWIFNIITYLMKNIGGLVVTNLNYLIKDLTKEKTNLSNHLLESIKYDITLGIKGEEKPYYGKYFEYYLKELEYRKENNIFVEEV